MEVIGLSIIMPGPKPRTGTLAEDLGIWAKPAVLYSIRGKCTLKNRNRIQGLMNPHPLTRFLFPMEDVISMAKEWTTDPGMNTGQLDKGSGIAGVRSKR
ncbi:hypothetical protein PSTEL_22140 [Paenibacillus stellifer]|uniref:Uncharacterized protein n=1 Tax=Paenibacillus stellifer TaxID=169760 RepID=A0A089LX15_9BACL|nr:hypothetical protein PSTEL_22140 [Paenibacillus stellifer]